MAAVASTLLAAVGHAAAGGSYPPIGTLLVFGVLLAAVLIGLADKRRCTFSILAVLAGSQLTLHLLFELIGAHQDATPSDSIDPLAMIGAHAATLVGGWLLGCAEQTVFAFAEALARVVPRRLTPLLVWRPLPTFPVVNRVSDPELDVLRRRVHLRRGPPVPA